VLAARSLGWLNTGVVAAVLVDLGFHPRDGAGVFQLLGAPGLLAHGMELANKPVTAMPYVDDEHYVIEKRK
jgi:citrate synthase